MSEAPERVLAARRALEATYGLALEGVSDDQIAATLAAAGVVVDPLDPGWLERVVDRLPVDESWLFRDDELWTWLLDEAGPALLDHASAHSRPLRILSLGCSTGQEAFSLAILFQHLLELRGIPGSAAAEYVSILGIDSSPARIDVARTGQVNAWSVQRARPAWLRGRVTLEDAQSGRHRVDAAVRALCRFEVGNLVTVAGAGNPALGGFDLVLCRNVLIYFRAAEAQRLAAELSSGMDAGALLVFSATEAHLLAGSAKVEPLGPLGAGRILRAPPPQGFLHTPVPGALAPRGPLLRPVRPRRRAHARPAPGPAVPAPTPRARPAGADAVAAHLREALEHAGAGRTGDALREARAALFHEPGDLFSRMLLGQQLVTVDAVRGREVLRELLATATRLPADSSVPGADGLSVGQLATAVRLLLSKAEVG